MKEKEKNILDEIGYLCSMCATKLGGKCPDVHCATFHTGVCDVCKQKRSLCNVGDWNWSDKKRRGMRD